MNVFETGGGPILIRDVPQDIRVTVDQKGNIFQLGMESRDISDRKSLVIVLSEENLREVYRILHGFLLKESPKSRNLPVFQDGYLGWNWVSIQDAAKVFGTSPAEFFARFFVIEADIVNTLSKTREILIAFSGFETMPYVNEKGISSNTGENYFSFIEEGEVYLSANKVKDFLALFSL